MTVVWHIDGLQISHVDRNMVSSLILNLESLYGEMHVSRGHRRDYLGMWIDFSKKREVKISMEDYLQGLFNDFRE